ncbi:hypothetical protein BJV77DRAFT_658346 [Russula vinacea]|nr:hypothetical protein BJV77DRAFT_658346 [Russula vinacea]
MRKPWAKRLEVSVPLAHTSHPRASRHSLGVQTDPVNITTNILAAPTDPPPAPEGGPQTIDPTLARGGSKTFPLDALSSPVSSSLLHGVRVGLPPTTKTAAPKMGAVHPRDAERDHNLSSMKVDSITSSSIPPSIDMHHPISSAPAKQERVSANLERWSPSVPVPALPATGPSDETSESANSSSDSEDGNPPAPAPERPWSPSVPAALSTLASRRHNNAGRKAEQPENANGSSENQPVPPRPSTSTPTPPTPSSPTKTKPPKAKSNSFVPSDFVSGIVGVPPSSSDEDSKAGLLPEKISSVPSSARRFTRSQANLPPIYPVEVPSSPSTLAHPPSPSMRKDHSPSRLSPASSRGSFSHGPLDSSATSVPSHPSSPKQSLRKPQALSGHPFDQVAMMAPQISTHLSAQVLSLASLLRLPDLPRVLVRFVVIHLSTHPYVDDRQLYPVRMPSPLLRATRRLPLLQPLEDRLLPLHNPFTILIHSVRRCHQNPH